MVAKEILEGDHVWCVSVVFPDALDSGRNHQPDSGPVQFREITARDSFIDGGKEKPKSSGAFCDDLAPPLS